MPAVRKVQSAYDRAEQLDRNLRVAFAMAAYHADNGKYPAKLDDLAPKYLAKVPDDVFSGKALIYKPGENGFLVYSVGVNGQDDGGRWIDDEPRYGDPIYDSRPQTPATEYVPGSDAWSDWFGPLSGSMT